MAVYRDRTILMPICYMLQFNDFQGELAIHYVQEARGIIPMFTNSAMFAHNKSNHQWQVTFEGHLTQTKEK
jgi:hypothetical protein